MLALQDSLAGLKQWKSRDGGTPCWHRVGGDWWCLEELIPHPAVFLLGAGTQSCAQAQRSKGLTVPEAAPSPSPSSACTSCV